MTVFSRHFILENEECYHGNQLTAVLMPCNDTEYFHSQTPTPAFVEPVIINFYTDLNYLFDIKSIHSITP